MRKLCSEPARQPANQPTSQEVKSPRFTIAVIIPISLFICLRLEPIVFVRCVCAF